MSNPEGINAGAEGFGIREQDVTYQVGRFLYDILSEDDRFEARLSRPTPQTTLGYSNTKLRNLWKKRKLLFHLCQDFRWHLHEY